MKTTSFRSFLFIAAVSLLACLRTAGAEGVPWLTDYNAAIEQANKENRNILLDFTGSDWCPVCMEMEKNTFNTAEFKDFAAKNLVLLQLDFPLSKPVPDKLKAQNEHLSDVYGVGDGFPVYILIDKTGKVLVRNLGGVPGGPAAFIALLEGKKT